ncbi:autotransporter strand-loop-strand O-heptosyltransferase, partial [Acetobacter sp. AN02]|uniref:autotransporter strand-loop-strand O-heptosyltransferase n=1 Tax=Acetobacter sp. AN02 TaxID=2894186 RepID=UPI0024342736
MIPSSETSSASEDICSDSAVSSPPAISANCVPPPQQPVIAGPEGIFFDFNLGARLSLPVRETGKWKFVIKDLDTGNILFTNETAGAFVRSSKRFYVRFGLEVHDIREDGTTAGIFRHELDLRNRKVIIQFPVGTLGDTLAWFPYAERFALRHGAEVTCVLSGAILPLFRDSYPDLKLISQEDAKEQDIYTNCYASYCLGLFFDDEEHIWQPTDFRFTGLHRTARYILGVDPSEVPRVSPFRMIRALWRSLIPTLGCPDSYLISLAACRVGHFADHRAEADLSYA